MMYLLISTVKIFENKDKGKRNKQTNMCNIKWEISRECYFYLINIEGMMQGSDNFSLNCSSSLAQGRAEHKEWLQTRLK